MEAQRVPLEVNLGPSEAQAELALQYIDAIITDIYFPFRGDKGYETERATLVESPHQRHRENDAEHSWHLTFTVRALWDNREELGLVFPDDFDINKALWFCTVHDVPEIETGDVDALTSDEERRSNKAAETEAAIFAMRRKHRFLKIIAPELLEYENKECPEAQFVSDIDKILGTRVICHDNGRKWHNWEGEQFSREHMSQRMREKLLTENGHAIFDALERDLDNHPEYFPATA